MKRIRAKEQLDEFIFNAIESLRNGKKQPNEDTIHVTINEDLTSATMEQKERLATLLDQKKLLNKPHGGKNSYYKTQNNDNSSPQTPLPPTQLPIKPIINKNQNKKLISQNSLQDMSKFLHLTHFMSHC